MGNLIKGDSLDTLASKATKTISNLSQDPQEASKAPCLL